jgi:enoyl-CoA hydratase/carnithine racemase
VTASGRQAKKAAVAIRRAKHFDLRLDGKIATVTLDRPERKNPLTFESYAELRDFFGHLVHAGGTKAVILAGAGGNFSSGGDVHDIIGPLVQMEMPDLLKFTRMTGDLVKAIRACPQTVIAAIDGVCAGAGACLAMASDFRIGTPRSKVAFLFTRVGLAGCDMGACAILPRIVGQGRAAELLFTGRSMSADEALAWGFYTRLVAPEALMGEATALAASLAEGPTFAHAMTKRMLDQEWAMGVAEAIEQEAQAQAICMKSGDFHRAYEAFVKKAKPVFEGN